MAALAPLSTPVRQPFGILSETKVRSLQSVKNKQNAIVPHSVPSLKRRAPSPELSDSENVDPNILDSFGKRKRAAFNDDVSLCKPSRYSIQVIPAATKPVSHATTMTTPRIDTMQKPSATSLSAPPAAGRSPTRGKRLGLLKPGKRLAPPSFGARTPALSIHAALKGTLAHKKAKKARTIEETKPKSWFFDIFEETNEQQDYRMNEWTMTQSATILDISDDEGKAQAKSDRGKENIDPNETSSPAARLMATTVPKVSRKDMMHDEPRTPLGDLNPAEFYGEGMDATSVVLVHDDVETLEEESSLQPSSTKAESKADFTFETEEKLPRTAPESAVDTSDIGALLAAAVPVWTDAAAEAEVDAAPVVVVEGEQPIVIAEDSIEIWESESAKDENEKDDANFDESGVFALQEI